MKNKLLDEFKSKIGDPNSVLSDGEKQALMEEMDQRLTRMGQMLEKEQSSQNSKLEDILAARRKKKEDLKNKFLMVSEGVEQKAAEFNDKLVEIADQQEKDMANIEKEIEQEREKGLYLIDENLKKSKNERLAEMEKKLEALKKAGGRSTKD